MDVPKPNKHEGPLPAQLSDSDQSELENLYIRIQNHKGKWMVIRGGEEAEPGVISMPYTDPDPLISEFMEFMYDKDLVINFDWASWQEGRDFFTLDDPDKYSHLNTETTLKLITAILRNDRFNDGALASSFESGDMQKLIEQLISFRKG